MVGIIDDTAIHYPLGSRIKIGDNVGTVKYVGDVFGHVGTWLGIEWDDAKRGKHNGSVDGKHYFATDHPTSGSFIRPGKVCQFESVEQAASTRYLTNSNSVLDAALMKEAQASIQAPLFEVVGMERISRKLSRFEQLSVKDCPVNSAGFLQDFSNLTTLNVSNTLIWRWETVADIVRQVPTLLNLDLSGNRLQLPSNAMIAELEPVFRNLRHINMSNCGFKQWANVVHTARLWPHVHVLGLQDNKLTELTEVDCTQVFKQLKELFLNSTNLMDFGEVVKLGNIQSLTFLSVMDNEIEQIKLPDCEPDAKLQIFQSLEQLNISHNPIWNEAHAFNELDKLPKLKRLHKTPNMKTNFSDMLSKAVGMIGNLEMFNKISIKSEERRGAEYDLWKKHALEWIQASKAPETLREFYKTHRTYASIIKKYGSPADFVPTTVGRSQSNLLKISIRNQESGEIWEKRLPRSITVQTLQGLILKHFHLEREQCHLAYVDATHPDLLVPLESGAKTLDYYSLQDGDTVLVQYS